MTREISTDYFTESASETRELVFLYDESSMVGFTYSKNGATPTSYYYQRNLLGDVIGIYTTSGTKVVEYAYDAWGNCTIKNSTTNYNLAHANPIRYRGYYYDEDTKLYYLNARYYSPEFRRFISPDDTSYLNPENVNGLNLYCYCNNDPVNFVDPNGNAWETIWDIASLITSAGEVLANPYSAWAWAGLLGDVVDVVIPFVGGVGESIDVIRVSSKVVDAGDDIIDTAKNMRRLADTADDMKISNGTYVIIYKEGQHYIGKGGFGRAIQSAAQHFSNGNKVIDIIWAPMPTQKSAFIAEYLMQSTLGVGTLQPISFNRIWSPGRKIYNLLK